MMNRRNLSLMLAWAAVLAVSGSSFAGASARRWVWFADKGPSVAAAAYEDAPVYPPYVAAVEHIAKVRHATRWFNGVSVTADEGQIARIRRLPFVEGVTPVAAWRRGRPRASSAPTEPARRPAGMSGFDYGPYGYGQMHLVKADSLQLLGLSGAGVRIAIFDDGFNFLDHPAFARVLPHIVGAYDFVDNDGNVNVGGYYTSHGTEVFSCLAGFAEGSLIGPAYDAEFLLARTENEAYERPVEEDNWVAAAEWAVANGADIISSSVGYNWFENDSQGNWFDSSYTPDQLDGKTALITRAAQKAASRGVVVVNAAGNERGYSTGRTYWDGKVFMPADGDSVIAVTATDMLRRVPGFTSLGPTADGRIKPDVAALGVSVYMASGASGYAQNGGTSFATPVVAGVAAQLLQAHPTWDPMAILTALRLSGSQSLAPDTVAGWGVIDGLRALAADSAVYGRMTNAATGQVVTGYVHIVNAAGAVVRFGPVSADGWFLFERIPPGTYRVRGYWPYQEVGADTTITLPMLPREIRLRLRASDTVANRPTQPTWWVSEPTPNPANPTTTIRFRIHDLSPGDVVRMTIYSLTGQAIGEVSARADWSGRLTWNGRDGHGRAVASGVYFARISLREASVVRRIVVLR